LVYILIRPAAAVIPAPIAYIKVAAVKKLVVGFLTSDRLTRPGYWLCVDFDPVILVYMVIFSVKG
jgi:hypothetical protein